MSPLTAILARAAALAHPSTLDGNSMQASEDLDMMRGRHHISFGGEWLHYQFNYANIYQSNGAVTFDGYASGNALLDFMLGLPDAVSARK